MGIINGLTAERMQEIVNQQILSGGIDLSGDLVLTRADGSSFNAGRARGDKGDPANYPFPTFSNSGLVNYVRIGVLDGISTSGGAAFNFLLSGVGRIDSTVRGTILVHVAQRGIGGIGLRAWSWGLEDVAGNAVRLFTRSMGNYLFEVWAEVPIWNMTMGVSVLRAYNTTVALNTQTALPSGMIAYPIERSDSPSASQTVAGMIEIATNAEVLTGTDATRAVSPAGLASVVGAGEGYRYFRTIQFDSDGTFSKASYPGLRAVRVRLVGGGGGGGSVPSTGSGVHSTGSGGGGGGYAEGFILDSSLAASTAVNVGAGGTIVANGKGNTGGTSSFGSLVVATGGEGGDTYASNANWVIGSPGLGGIGTAGDVIISGDPGQPGGGMGSLAHGGGGGGSVFGSGAVASFTPSGSGSVSGYGGRSYGGGGGGAAANAGGGSRGGGLGSKGVVFIDIYR